MLSFPLGYHFRTLPSKHRYPTGRDAQLRGKRSEERALRLARTLEWVAAARLGTPDEDHHGTDIVVDTVSGETLAVQVKSSVRAAEKFRARYPNHPILLVGDRSDYDVLCDLDRLRTG